ncbi:hypothetical protein [Amycolatopsis tolypomycina]|uniref:hypothetical protein n=1 Tax=Amycolatopsis tolypomycina TaxID=208445 RepID=UPI0033ADA442
MRETGEEEAEAREGVRADWTAEVANTMGGEIAEAVTPIARDVYESREQDKIQADAKLVRQFGKKSEE